MDEKIDKTLDVILENVKHKDLATFWPVPLPDVEPCYVDLFVLDFFDLMKEVDDKGVSEKELVKHFRYPSKFWNIIWNTLVGSKVSNVDVDKRMFLLNHIYAVIVQMKSGSIFNDNNENLILNPTGAKEVIDNTKWIENASLNLIVSELNSLLLAYCESIFFVYHKDGLEKHGPYQVRYKGTSSKLVVRDGYDLKPTDIWREVKDFPFESITTYILYQEDTQIGFDIFNNPIINESLSGKVTAFHVVVSKNGEQLQLSSKSELEDVVQSLEKYISSINQKIESWSLEEKTKKHIEISWHTLKPGFQLLVKDWKTDSMREALERVDKGCIQYHEVGGDLRSFLDPRL